MTTACSAQPLRMRLRLLPLRRGIKRKRGVCGCGRGDWGGRKIPSLCCKLSPPTEKFCGSSLSSRQSLEGPGECHSMTKKRGKNWEKAELNVSNTLYASYVTRNICFCCLKYVLCVTDIIVRALSGGSTHPTTGLRMIFLNMLDANTARCNIFLSNISIV